MSIKNPILIDFPMPIQTERLTLRPVREGDGKMIFEAIEESMESLLKWVPWAKHVKKWEDSETFARESYAHYILRKSLILGMFQGDRFLGICSFNYFLWPIPSGEIGYWCRTSKHGKGFTAEAVRALTKYGFETLGLKRIIISCIEDNHASARVAEKLGFELEVQAARGLVENPHDAGLIMGRRYVRFHENGL